MTDVDTAHQLLGLKRGASVQEVEAAFQRLSDRFQSDPSSDPWEFDAISGARDLLLNELSSQGSGPGFQKSDASAPQTHAMESLPANPTAPPRHLLWKAFFQQLPLQNETCMFIFLSVMDIFMTYSVVRFGAYESNPIAAFFLNRWGFDGLIFFKMVMVTLVAVSAQIIARKDLIRAGRILKLGSIVVGLVVCYSMFLLSRLLY